MKIGIGYDVHRFDENRKLILGGVEINHNKGLLGHSDADVLIHAINDAILGALGLGDIGIHFPDTDMNFKDISSLILLKKVITMMKNNGFEIVNCDNIIILERPKVFPYIDLMKKTLSATMEINPIQLNIKATTTEGLGFCGREEGIAAQSIVLLNEL
ncbi:MAG: 2-C-methyl-D-erythritol 2,4-cyclodiphosphate synthase [Actinobacteria bacterium]|nr:2-C-methyl-D-erythritol 2,4-cyclodiphosphate synthase [Cyanobacteriota bacterium]MCL5771745.1 2-C-methyl-D-erythritol 2,4-cyclodiphosphate synthase [Actinomycetota bacterium]